MTFSVKISVDGSCYIFKAYNNHILINNKVYNVNIDSINITEKESCLYDYESYISEGKNSKYAEVKSCLFYAPYTHLGNTVYMELMDTIVLYLLNIIQLPRLSSDMHIIIANDEIYTDLNPKKYSLPYTNSDHIDYDYDILLTTLINDHNFRK
jgi:hypothetical protein